jgi:hypothetical protein
MKKIRFSTAVIWLELMACLWGLDGLTRAEEPPKIIRELNYDECDPVRLQGAVMSVNLENTTITVAEKEIRLMDVGSDDQRIKTALMNTEGKPEKFESFKVGQLVQVDGFKHPEGFVSAASIQKIKAMQGTGKPSKDRLGKPEQTQRSSLKRP